MTRILHLLISSILPLLAFAWLAAAPIYARDSASEQVDSISVLKAFAPDSLKLGGKVVYLDFWASWCAPCKNSFPWLIDMSDRYKESGFRVVTVNLDRDHEAALRFLKELQAPFFVHYDSTGEVAEQFRLQGMPTSLLYGRDGVLRSRHEGFSPADTLTLENTIKELLKEKAGK